MPNEPPHARGRGRALYEEIKARILDGTYAAGAELPSTRACGAERGLSRTTVSSVYEQLASEGFIETQPGALSRVAAGVMAPQQTSGRRSQTSAQPRRTNAAARLSAIGIRVAKVELPPVEALLPGYIDFLYGPLAGRDFPTLAWLKAARQVERERPARLAYDDPRGDTGLRRALQTYLARARGLSCDLEQLIIVNGSQQAVDLCARLLLDVGDNVVVENPGYRMAHHAFEAVGAQLYGIGVDAHGLKTDDLGGVAVARLVYVTPTHQYPLGAFLSIGRRHALLQWAAKQQAWILEDDYDSEYRYAVRPEATLQSLDHHGSVIYVGTFSKTLSPQLRLGYMVLPHALAATFATAKRLVDRHAASGAQRTLALLLENGAYERHVRRVRRLQQTRRDTLLAALDRYLAGKVTVLGAASGLHLVVQFDGLSRTREADLVAAARAEKVLVYPLDPLYLPQNRPSPNSRRAALVLGYSTLVPEQIELGVRRLALALRRMEGVAK
ncbi:PLP-dependent aminotransferase family protein [Polaromonas sp. P1(28)-13]|nr:PLP-dependent aminotransferase family protein [Polaromonas sp. P1(28)-13]